MLDEVLKFNKSSTGGDEKVTVRFSLDFVVLDVVKLDVVKVSD